MNATTFVTLLPDTIRQSIYRELLQLELSQEDIDNAMDSRLCDLEDTIDISKYIN